MKPLRTNLALAIDGGGIKGVMVARALVELERETGEPIGNSVGLVAGTSTGAIIAIGIACGMSAGEILELYKSLGPGIFRKSWRNLPLVRYLVPYRYDNRPLIDALRAVIGEKLGDSDITIGELRQRRPDFNIVITITDVLANKTRFVKLYKERYAGWRLWEVVVASSTVPTVFPVFGHDYERLPDDPPDEEWIPKYRYWVDGGVGSYCNPCYMAAYEIAFCLGDQGWSLDNSTLLSFGTGRDPQQKVWGKRLRGPLGGKRTPREFLGPEWVFPAFSTFLHDANEQQVRLVKYFFCDAVATRAGDPGAALDFRRFDLTFDEPIAMDDVSSIEKLEEYGRRLGEMLVNDQEDVVGGFSFRGTARSPAV